MRLGSTMLACPDMVLRALFSVSSLVVIVASQEFKFCNSRIRIDLLALDKRSRITIRHKTRNEAFEVQNSPPNSAMKA